MLEQCETTGLVNGRFDIQFNEKFNAPIRFRAAPTEIYLKPYACEEGMLNYSPSSEQESRDECILQMRSQLFRLLPDDAPTRIMTRCLSSSSIGVLSRSAVSLSSCSSSTSIDSRVWKNVENLLKKTIELKVGAVFVL